MPNDSLSLSVEFGEIPSTTAVSTTNDINITTSEVATTTVTKENISAVNTNDTITNPILPICASLIGLLGITFCIEEKFKI